MVIINSRSIFLSSGVFSCCIQYSSLLAGSVKDRERKKHLSRGKEAVIAQLWHRCSKMLYRLLTHTNRRLHKASCSASVAFRDAIVNCPSFFSINLSVLLPSSSYQTPAALCHFPSVHRLLRFSSFVISYLQPFLSILHTTVITPYIYFPLCLWVINMLTIVSKKIIKVKLEFFCLVLM